MRTADVVILGAGAAGLMCAAIAARRGRQVLVLDHAAEPAGKILISGGGRCNFTNLNTVPERFLSQNPAFCRSALAAYTPRDFLALVERHRIAWHEKTLGQLFCDGSARQIVAMLLAECAAGGAAIGLRQHIGAITGAEGFRIETSSGPVQAESLVLATGGLSIPKLGATDIAHRVAAQFGLRLTEIRPGLVPLILPPQDLPGAASLAGVSLTAAVRCGKMSFQDGMVFTHRGLSGPAILQISSFWREGGTIALDLLAPHPPQAMLASKLARPRVSLRTALAGLVPRRLAEAVLPPGLAESPIAGIGDRVVGGLESSLRAWPVHPAGTGGYAKAEVTVGGVDTRDLAQQTMQARQVPGLFVIGEAVDVTGWLGGYNFQWAWASAVAAGRAA